MWKRVRRVEERRENGEEGVGGGLGNVEKKLREMEWGWEKKEREKRKKNIIIREMEAEEGREETVVKKLCKKLEVVVKVEKVRRIKMKGEEKKEMLVVKLGKEEEKRELLRKKRLLKGSNIWIERFDMEGEKDEMGAEEVSEKGGEKKGEVWVGYNKMRINREWWFWDEKIEDVRNWRGNKKGRKTGGKAQEREGANFWGGGNGNGGSGKGETE